MTCENKCVNCPLVASINAESADLETAKQTMIGRFERAMELDEQFDDKLALLTWAQETGVKLSPEAEVISVEALRDLASNALTGAAGFLDEYFDVIDETLEINRTKAELIQANCDGPKERRRFIFFGQKVLKCSSRTPPSKDKRKNTRIIE